MADPTSFSPTGPQYGAAPNASSSTPAPNAPAPVAPTIPAANPSPNVPSNPSDTLTGNFSGVNPNATLKAQNGNPPAPNVSANTNGAAPNANPTQPAHGNVTVGPNGIESQTPAPNAPAQVTSPTPTAAKPVPETTVGAAPGQAPLTPEQRSSQIFDNMTKLAGANPNLLTDRNSFNTAFGYSSKSPEEKAVVDSFWNAHQQNPANFMFDQLARGQTLANPNTAQAVQAKAMWDAISPYKGASADTIYAGMQSGKIVPGSIAYNDLVRANGGVETPQMLQAKQQYVQSFNTSNINRDMNVVSGAITGVRTPNLPSSTKTVSDNVMKQVSASNPNATYDAGAEYQKMLANNPEINDLVKNLNQSDKDIKDLEYQKTKVIRDLAAQHPGISSGQLYELAQEQIQPMNDQINQLQNQRGIYQANLEYKTNIANKAFEFENNQQIATIAFQRQQDLAKYTEQLKTGDVNSTDPYIQRQGIQNAVQQVYDKYGPLMQQPASQHAANIQALMQKGMSFDQAIQEDLLKPLQAKQGFAEFNQALQNKAVGLTEQYKPNPLTGELYNVKTGLPVASSASSTTTNGSLPSVNIARTGQNVGQDANNPGNITVIPGVPAPKGATGIYKSPNGRSYYTFASMQDGLDAEAADIQAKQSGNTSTGLNGNSTLAQFVATHVNGPNGGPADPSYLQRVINATGASANTPISQISASALAKGIAAGEGVDTTRNASIQVPASGSSSQYDPGKTSLYEAYAGGKWPTKMPTMGPVAEQFRQEAQAYLSSPEAATKAMNLLINNRGDTSGLVGNEKSFVQSVFSSAGKNTSQLKPAMETLDLLSKGVGNTAVDHLNLLKDSVTALSSTTPIPPDQANTLLGNLKQTANDIIQKLQDYPAAASTISSLRSMLGNTSATDVNSLRNLAGAEMGAAYQMGTGGERNSEVDKLSVGSIPQQLEAIRISKQALLDKYSNANDAYKSVTGSDFGGYLNLVQKAGPGVSQYDQSSTSQEGKMKIGSNLSALLNSYKK